MKRPVSSVATHTLSVQEVWGSIPRPVKSTLRTRHRYISLELCSPGAKPRRWAPPLITRFDVMKNDSFEVDKALLQMCQCCRTSATAPRNIVEQIKDHA